MFFIGGIMIQKNVEKHWITFVELFHVFQSCQQILERLSETLTESFMRKNFPVAFDFCQAVCRIHQMIGSVILQYIPTELQQIFQVL